MTQRRLHNPLAHIPARAGIVAAATFLVLLGLATAATALDLGKLKGAAFGTSGKTVFVMLHGDGGPRDYFDRYAKKMAGTRGVVGVSLTRPGFSGPYGRSAGQNPDKDHYTSRNNKLLAQSLQRIKASAGASRLVVVGHSGGAGQLGTIVGAYPGIVDVAILAACPCDVPNWRIHRRGRNGWKQSQSPHRFARKIPASTTVIAITGTADENTLPRFAETYVAAARKAGKTVTLITPAGVTHKWSSIRPHVDRQVRKYLN